MTLWELAACVEGVNQANGGTDPMDDWGPGEFADLKERHRDFISATVH